MSIDEYADFQKAIGSDVVNIGGVWWRKVRPFFYQPLFPLLEATPDSIHPPFLARIGGYKHMVPSEQLANSRMNFIVDYSHDYSINKLNHNRRNIIKRSMKYFLIKPMDNLEEFIHAGYPVYRSFYSRTKYKYKKERVDKKYFTEWAETLFRFPKVKILGAFQGEELSAVDVSYLVEDVLIDGVLFSKTEALKYQVLELIIHTLREKTAACSGIRYIYKGPVTGQKGLDNYKLIRGCKIISKPAFYRINPLAGIILRNYMAEEHKKLTGKLAVDVDGSEEELSTSHG